MKNELNRSNKQSQTYTVQAPKRSECQSHREKSLPFRWVLHNVDHSQYFRLKIEQKHMVWNAPFWSLVFSTVSMCSCRASAMAFDFLAPTDAFFGIFTSLNWHLRTIYGTYRIVFNCMADYLENSSCWYLNSGGHDRVVHDYRPKYCFYMVNSVRFIFQIRSKTSRHGQWFVHARCKGSTTWCNLAVENNPIGPINCT